MRHALLSVVLCWCLAPVCAAVQFTTHDPAYKIVPVPGMSGMRVDWAQRAVFITTVAGGPRHGALLRARETAREKALAAARKQTDLALRGVQVTGYASVPELLTAGILPARVVPAFPDAVRPVVECWDAARRELTLVCILPLSGPSTPGELAARLLELEQQRLAGQTRVYPVDEITFATTIAANQLSTGPYTGVIFDATGLGVTPVLLPKLLAKDGTEVWGTGDVNPQRALEKGVAIYAETLRAALDSGRVGASPLVIRPIGTFGKIRGDLVLSDEDIALLRAQDALTRFLPALAVAIVTEQR